MAERCKPMFPFFRYALAFSASLALAFSAAIARAQTPSLVGLWSHHVVDPQTGRPISIIWDEFGPNGQLHVKFVTPAGTIDVFGSYKVLNGGTVARAVYTDYEPKQTCTMICTPLASPVPIGQPGDSAMRFDGPDIVYFGADMYTRQR